MADESSAAAKKRTGRRSAQVAGEPVVESATIEGDIRFYLPRNGLSSRRHKAGPTPERGDGFARPRVRHLMRSQIGLADSEHPPNDFDLLVKTRRRPIGLDNQYFAVANLLRLMANGHGILPCQTEYDKVGSGRGELRIEAVWLTDDHGFGRTWRNAIDDWR